MQRCAVSIALWLTVCSAAAADTPLPGAPPAAHWADGVPIAANGHPALNDRRYDEVAYATTHNGMGSSQDGWIFPNQRYNVARQLADGIRGLMLDVYDLDGDVYLCHGGNGIGRYLGRKRLLEELCVVREFLDDNPHEVVTFLLEGRIDPADLEDRFRRADLLRLAHTQPHGRPWPTLRSMIEADRRLVVLTNHRGGEPATPWLHAMWDWCRDTPWHNREVADFRCEHDRGRRTNDLLIMNHFLMDPLPGRRLSARANANPGFALRARAVREWAGRIPNFVVVDFYDAGDVFEVVEMLNGVTDTAPFAEAFPAQ